MRLRSSRVRRKAEVNIVPMVDVLTVLIFFFLLTMQFKEIHAVDITPPTMKTADQTVRNKPISLAIGADGTYYMGEEKIPLEKLADKLKSLSKENPDMSLVLLADKDVPFHHVTSAVDAVKIAKIKKLSLQTNKAGK